MKIIKRILKKTRILIIAITIAITAVGSYSFIESEFEIAKNLDIFTTLFKQLTLNYVDEINPGELMKTGIDAMLRSLDPYTNYIPESDIEDYKFMTTGQYGGVGALIHQKDDYVVISEPYEGSPAKKVGLKAGDIILEVNGKSAKGKTSGEVSTILRGQPGTSVQIRVKRPGADENIDITITREEVKIDNIPYSGIVGNNIGYIKLISFTQNAGREVKDAFLKLKESNKLNGLILDLRGNEGGLLMEAVNITNIFVEKGQLVVHTKGKLKDKNRAHNTLNIPVDLNIPLVVLVNRGSASSSEIVAGAIQDLERGVIIGQTTFGKGLVQNVLPLSYNSKLKITVSKYYIPSGRCIQALDYSHKDEEGNPTRLPDSLATAFKTKGGRTVYDGGGIEPDIYIEPEKFSNIAISLISKYLVFDYATKFALEHPTIPAVVEFEINDDIYNDFVKFISDKDYDYVTRSEKALQNLKSYAQTEKYFDAIQSEYKVLKEKMTHDKSADLTKFRDEISLMLKNEIVSRYYYKKGRIEVMLVDDPEIAKANEVLNDQVLYKSILEGSYSEKKEFGDN